MEPIDGNSELLLNRNFYDGPRKNHQEVRLKLKPGEILIIILFVETLKIKEIGR